MAFQPGNRIRFGCGAMRCDAKLCAREEERFCWLVFPELLGPGDHDDVRVWWNGTQDLEPLPFHFIKGGTRQILRPVPPRDPASPCRRVSPCHRVSPCVIVCRRVSPCVAVCRRVSPCVAVCRRVSPCVVVCRRVSSCVVVCRRVSS